MLQKCLKSSHVIGRKLLAHASTNPITAERECNVLCALVAMALSPTISIILNIRLNKSVNCVQNTLSSDTVINEKSSIGLSCVIDGLC